MLGGGGVPGTGASGGLSSPAVHRRALWGLILAVGLLGVVAARWSVDGPSTTATRAGGAGRTAVDPGTTSTGEPAAPAEAPAATPPASTEAGALPAEPAPAAPVDPARRPDAAGDPAGLAAQIVAAEAAVADPATPPGELAAAAHSQQVAYRALGRHPEWDAEVLGAVPAELVERVQLNAAARREFMGMHTRLSDTLPAWRIVEPAPAADLLAHYQEAEATFGVGWEYLAAINLVETGMGRIRGTSTAGAQGPMQFIPSTWAAFGEGDIESPRDSILAAARYLAHNGFAAGNVEGALFNYNRHNNYVRGVSNYARVMELDPGAFVGFYHWQIYYASTAGDVWLPVGYEASEPVSAAAYVAAHP